MKGLMEVENSKQKSNVGHTIFKPTGVRHEFPHIDLEKQQVKCAVIYQEKTYMTVIVDIKSNSVKIEGSIDELGDLSMNREATIDLFKQEARFFIDNKIANAKEYYDEIIKNLS